MITVNIDKAKQVGHKLRRELRAEEFAPLDDQIAKQIPGINSQDIELQRQSIREKYATIQTQIDSAESSIEIKQALGI